MDRAAPAGSPKNPAGSKTFTLALETPDGKLPPVSITVPEVPLGLADLVPLVFGLDDGAVDLAIRRAAGAGRRVSCKSGCGQCCCQLVPVSAPEAIYIMETVFSEGNSRSGVYRERFSEIRDRLEKDGFWQKLMHIDQAKDQSALAAEYWLRRIPCPFLLNDSCSIYSARPCICREYNVVSEPALCEDLLSTGVRRIKIHQKMTTALAKTAGLLLSCPPKLIPLTIIPWWYEEHRTLADMRWMGVGLFDLLLECVRNP